MQQFLKSNIKLKISIGFLLAFIAFIVVQLLSNKSIENLKSSEKEMLSSNLLSNRIGTIESSIKAYESKTTKFIYTGDKKFLSGNEESLRNASVNLQYVQDASQNSAQTILINQLDSLVKTEIEFIQQTLIDYDHAKRFDAITLMGTGRSEQLISDITDISNRIKQQEESNLARIISNNEANSRKVAYMDYTATAFALAVILLSIFILFTDINKRVKVEHQLRIAQEKAEQSAIMKEQFMANMSHEIRTPMNAIIGFAGLLSKSKLDNNQKNHLNAIQASGENLMNIINDILDFSKIEAGMVNIEKIPFSPAELLHSVNVMFLPKAHDKKIQLDFFTSAKLPPIVKGDPSRLTQILINLVSNALKFTSEGSVSVKTELVKEEGDDLYLQFTVKDTGIGIPKEKTDEIFERFTQANADTSRKYGGSGLGLSITKKLVELQGGTIRVESAEGVGSSFSCVIPYKKSSDLVRNAVRQEIQPKQNSKINILVAEDNSLNQYLINSLLEAWGFDFDIVENGKLAIEKLSHTIESGNKDKYNLVLMDIQMPEMNGYDTAQTIRRKLHLQMPIIAMTAHVLPGEREKCLHYGMSDYISKPIHENELYNLITKYVNAAPATEKTETSRSTSKDESNRITNLDYIKELSNGNYSFINHMIDLFSTENPIEIQRLEKAIQNEDYHIIQSLAHKIKSNISFAGLDTVLKDKLNEIEELAAHRGSLLQIKNTFSKVKTTCMQAVEELKEIKINPVDNVKK